jgi:desulfoferrodoxin
VPFFRFFPHERKESAPGGTDKPANHRQATPGGPPPRQGKTIPREGERVTVTVGSVAHPMLDNHYIEWIALQTKSGNQRKGLHPGDEPKAVFLVPEDDEIVDVYAYCNLHGLWKA